MVCTVSAMDLMSWMVPRTLEAWVQVTSLVREERRGLRESGVSLGLVVGSTVHHVRVRFLRAAMATHEAMLASWSSLETMISSPGENLRAMERLRKSWVVEAPMTFGEQLVDDVSG